MIQNGGLVAYAALMLFFVLEAIFMFVPQTHRIGYTLASQRWFQYYVHKNNIGYRDEPITEERLKNKIKIFVFGDSFTAGHGIKDPDDRYPDKLESMLPENYVVLNLGRNGTGTQDQLFRYMLFPIKPQIFILGYHGNDIDEVCGIKDSYPYKPYTDLPPW